MRLAVARPGWRLGLRRGLVEARGPGGEVVKVALAEVDGIIVSTRAASISSRLIVEAAASGIPVYVVDPRGGVVASLDPVPSYRGGDKILAQARWRLDEGLRVRAASWFVEYKLRARAKLLRLIAKSRAPWLRDLSYSLEYEASRARSASSTRELMSLEAGAGRSCWPALAEALGLEGFPGRVPRGGDPWNTVLDYVYSLLTGVAHRSLVLAGLNPYIGFLHAERSGRPSMALDFVEPYRWIGEWIVYRMSSRGREPVLAEEGRLDHETRRWVLEHWVGVLERGPPGIQRPLEKLMYRDAWGLGAAFVEDSEWSPTLPPY